MRSVINRLSRPETVVVSRSAGIVITVILSAILITALAPSAYAKYNFDGFPLTQAAQGEIQGNVLTFETLGLANSPMTCTFNIPGDVQWAKVYTGVWGGTPDYRGWAQVQVNDHLYDKTILLGKQDTNDNVLVTGYGVYWLSYDATTLLKKGTNTVTVNTSQRDPESKIDGRIYTILVVAAVKDPNGPVTEYWVSDGNVNLHSLGWTPGANANVLDQTSINFNGVDTGAEQANLTTVELTSTKGQPDYLLFNGKDLGVTPSDASDYLPGAIDIGDECSFDANGGTGIPSRYVDMETFDITKALKSDDNVTFQRGRDLNGDGEITTTGDKPEGEDYIHPVFAMITVQKAKASPTGPDLAVEGVQAKNAYNGVTGSIVATLRNVGSATSAQAEVTYTVDGKTIATQHVTVDTSGIQQVSADWNATGGKHTISVEAKLDGDTDASNDVATAEVNVGSLPDLVLTMSAPVTSGAQPTQQSGSSLTLLAVGAGIAIAAALIVRRPPGGRRVLGLVMPIVAALLVVMLLSSYVLPMTIAEGNTGLYLLPVTIKNIGGSDTPSFNVTIYIDSHKAATRSIDQGVAAGNETSLNIPIYTTPGKHTIKAVADEEGLIKEASKENNVAEADYDFP